MSFRSESEESTSLSDAVGRLEDWYHVPILLLVMATMFAIRMLGYERFVQSNEVLFSGNDAWYHLREVNYTVRHWPFTMPFDPWTNFPYGTSVGQFGTLYDQIVATVALILGLGSPSQELVAKTLLVAPAVFGALTAIPVYLIGKRLGGRLAGLFGAVILMLLPGTFLQRTLVGVADHNGVEPLFQAAAVLGLMVAFAVAEREKPVWELVEAREWESLREPVTWAAVGGVLTALYMWVWPPGVLLVGIVGTFLVVKIASDVVHEASPEPVAFAGAVSMSIAGLLMLVQIESFGFTTTHFSLLQPLVAFAVAGGCVFLAWLAREWEARDVEPTYYPAAVFGLVAAVVALTALLVPSLYNLVVNNLLRIVGFSANAQTRTIGEAQPFLSPSSLQQFGYTAIGRIVAEYGFTFFTAAVAVVWMLGRPLLRKGESREVGYFVGGLAVVAFIFVASGAFNSIANALGVDEQLFGLFVVGALLVGATLLARYDAEHLLVVVWAAFITSAAFTQVRFNYYLAVVVAVLNAYLLAEVLGLLDLRGSASDALEGIQGYQVLAVLAAVLLIVTPALVIPVSVGSAGGGPIKSNTAYQIGNFSSPGSVQQWEGSLEWLQSNTPAEGDFGGAENAEQLDYYGTFEKTDDYAYPDGAYGVMSWWDYGHWITVEGERIPNANPFQQGARTAANYLLAPNESQANRILERQTQNDNGATTRYVMVDWKMATPGEKFGAPVVFYNQAGGNLTSEDFYFYMWQQTQNGGARPAFLAKEQRYYESQMVRLYEYHGSAMDPQPIVLDWESQTYTNTQTGENVTVRQLPAGNESAVKSFDNMSAARQFVEEDGSAQVGGFGPYPSEPVPALEHYRLVKASESTAYQDRGYLQSLLGTSQALGGIPQQFLTRTTPAWVKTFERVPGATLEGHNAPANSQVTAQVQLRVPSTNSTFTYTQHAQADRDGDFTMTLPYSTTGYDNFGPKEGYTNVSVRSTGKYVVFAEPETAANGTVTQYGANVSISEAKVVGADDSPKDVTLEKKTRAPDGANGTDNGTNVDDAVGNETQQGADNGTQTGNGTDGGANGSDNQSALTAPAVEAGTGVARTAVTASAGVADPHRVVAPLLAGP